MTMSEKDAYKAASEFITAWFMLAMAGIQLSKLGEMRKLGLSQADSIRCARGYSKLLDGFREMQPHLNKIVRNRASDE